MSFQGTPTIILSNLSDSRLASTRTAMNTKYKISTYPVILYTVSTNVSRSRNDYLRSLNKQRSDHLNMSSELSGGCRLSKC